MDVISALKESGLIGLGGASFPTWKKWESVKNSPGLKKYVICNLSESEPGVFKDEYILQNHLQELVFGILLASKTVGASKSYIFLNDKFKRYLTKIKKVGKGQKIEVFIDTGRYLCGEETTLLQVMEGKLRQPRQKPPYPSEFGLYGYPTLINNAETLYRAYKLSQGEPELKRFYSISGDMLKSQLVEEKICAKIFEIIPKNISKQVEFVRVGGASGTFYHKNDFDQLVDSTGALELFSSKLTILDGLIQSISFLLEESCGKCTPCREGTYRIAQELNKLTGQDVFWEKDEIVQKIINISMAAKYSSFCSLGKSISRPVDSAFAILRNNK